MPAAKRYRRTIVVATCPNCGEEGKPLRCAECGIEICIACEMTFRKRQLCQLCYDEATENPWDVDDLR